MFLGHIGVGTASKAASNALPLWLLLMACQWSDLLWPILVLAGVESIAVDLQATVMTPLNFFHYPWSHSLLTNIIWGSMFAGLWFAYRRETRSAVVLFLCVLSHWILDWITHRPDMPLIPHGETYGLGLWNHMGITLPLELAMFIGGIMLYRRAHPHHRPGPFWGLVAMLGVIYVGNIFGPKPPVDTPAAALAGPALALWLLVPWGYWIEKPPATSSS